MGDQGQKVNRFGSPSVLKWTTGVKAIWEIFICT